MVTSDHFPSDYEPFSVTNWQLEVENGTIVLTFTDFNLTTSDNDGNGSICSDRLEVRNILQIIESAEGCALNSSSYKLHVHVIISIAINYLPCFYAFKLSLDFEVGFIQCGAYKSFIYPVSIFLNFSSDTRGWTVWPHPPNPVWWD